MTKSKMMPIPAGAEFRVTSGEYSDFSVIACYKALVEIDTEKVQEDYLKTNPKAREAHNYSEYDFVAWLEKSGLVKHIDQWEWHVGSYGTISTYVTEDERTICRSEDADEVCEICTCWKYTRAMCS